MGMFDYQFLCLLSSIFPSIHTVSFVLTLFLTLCTNSWNIQALRRATKEELKQHCSRCDEFGHNCLSCSMPMTDEWVLLLNIYPPIILIFVTKFWQCFFSFKSFTLFFLFSFFFFTWNFQERFPKPRPTKAAPAGPIKSPRKTRKPPHCSECGAAGHNRRSCIVRRIIMKWVVYVFPYAELVNICTLLMFVLVFSSTWFWPFETFQWLLVLGTKS